MPIRLTSRQKTGLLLIPALSGLGILAVLSHLRPVTLIEILMSMFALGFVAYFCFQRISKKNSSFIHETMESLANGVIYFDAYGALSYFNAVAILMLPELSEPDTSRNFVGTYKKFLAFIYDKSLDIQDQSRLTIDMPYMDLSRLLFREVVQLSSGRVILIQFYQRESREVAAIMTDISMMKTHIDEMAAVTEENRIMIKAIEAAGSGMMIAQSSGYQESVIFINEVFADALERPVSVILNSSFQKILQDGFEEQAEILKKAIDSARQGKTIDTVWLKAKKGKSLIWYAFYVLFFADSNNREFFVCFLSNQTEARLAQVRIHQEQKLEAIAKMAGGIAHDFNNILSIIDGYTNIIKKSVEKGQDISGFLESIDRSVKRGNKVTSQLLTFGQCRVKTKTRLNVSAHCADFEPFIKQMLDADINLIMSVQEMPCYADISPDSITQILMTLISNASEAMKNGGDLIISVSEVTRGQLLSFQSPVPRDKDYICLQIIDSGMGMDPEILGRIYEPFFTTKDRSKNSGLGMSLVYGLIKEVDGLIDIKSTPGVGTSITILIPAQCAPEHPLFADEEPAVGDLLKDKTILVVEDIADLLEMEGRFLSERGLKVLKASDGTEAMRLIEISENIDFVLSDVVMPGMSGIELQDRLKDDYPHIKTILLSAYPHLVETENMDTRIILAKPLKFEQLEEILTHYASGNDDESYLETRPHWRAGRRETV